MNKKSIQTIHEKNRIIDNIINALQEKNHFLFLGHQNPDEDCIGSMVAFALIVGKFSKKDLREQFKDYEIPATDH